MKLDEKAKWKGERGGCRPQFAALASDSLKRILSDLLIGQVESNYGLTWLTAGRRVQMRLDHLWSRFIFERKRFEPPVFFFTIDAVLIVLNGEPKVSKVS